MERFTIPDHVLLCDWPLRCQDRVLRGHISTATSLAFSPDSHTLATAGEDRFIKLWEPASGQLLHTMTGNTGFLRAVAFVGNDRLISADDLGNLHVWHTTQGQRLCTLESSPQTPGRLFVVSPDGHDLALGLTNGQVGQLDISRR
jgi:WD40 repeat protein